MARPLARRKGSDGMFETYRMLGEQQEAELIREAEKLARGTALARASRRSRRRYRLQALVTALVQLDARRPAQRVPRGRRRPT